MKLSRLSERLGKRRWGLRKRRPRPSGLGGTRLRLEPLEQRQMLSVNVSGAAFEDLNGNGIRDTARVLGISTDTVLNELKKKSLR